MKRRYALTLVAALCCAALSGCLESSGDSADAAKMVMDAQDAKNAAIDAQRIAEQAAEDAKSFAADISNAGLQSQNALRQAEQALVDAREALTVAQGADAKADQALAKIDDALARIAKLEARDGAAEEGEPSETDVTGANKKILMLKLKDPERELDKSDWEGLLENWETYKAELKRNGDWPNLMERLAKHRAAEAEVTIGSIKRNLEVYFTKHGSDAADLKALVDAHYIDEGGYSGGTYADYYWVGGVVNGRFVGTVSANPRDAGAPRVDIHYAADGTAAIDRGPTDHVLLESAMDQKVLEWRAWRQEKRDDD